MVVTDSQHGGIAEHSLFDDDTDIDADLTDAAMGYTHLLDEAMILIHQQNPKLLNVFIL